MNHLSKTLLLGIIFLTSTIYSQTRLEEIPSIYKFSEDLAPYKDTNQKYGFIDNKGNNIINAKYDLVGFFSDGYVSVANFIDGKTEIKFIDKNEKELPFKKTLKYLIKSPNSMPYFSNGYFRLGKKYYDLNGINPKHLEKYFAITDFDNNSLAKVYLNHHNSWLIIDKNGNIIDIYKNGKILTNVPYSADEYDFISSLENDIYLGKVTNIIWPEYTFYKFNKQKKRIYNISKKVYRKASPFKEGIAFIKKRIKSKGYFINTRLRRAFKVPKNWEITQSHKFSENITFLRNEQFEYNIYNLETKKILLKNNLKVAIFSKCSDGIIRYYKNSDKKFYFIDKNTGETLTFSFENVTNYFNGYACALINDRFHYVDKQGQSIFEFSK